jgi:Uncharacterized Fe-S protein
VNPLVTLSRAAKYNRNTDEMVDGQTGFKVWLSYENSGKGDFENMKESIAEMVRSFVSEYEIREEIVTRWGMPLVGFADAYHPDILKLKDTISSKHKLPSEILPEAKIVIAYFVPFTWELSFTNRMNDRIASPEWARAYEETNAMFRELNEAVVSELKKKGYDAAVPKDAFTFDQQELISNWSQRHFARAAGLGTFGINNMLITKTGCCGRYGTIVTNLDLEPDQPLEEELCFYLKNGRCAACVRRCPSGALTPQGYDRHKCYQVLRENAQRYRDFGSSYTDEEGEAPNSVGSEVCGKCATNVPCSFFAAR